MQPCRWRRPLASPVAGGRARMSWHGDLHADREDLVGLGVERRAHDRVGRARKLYFLTGAHVGEHEQAGRRADRHSGGVEHRGHEGVEVEVEVLNEVIPAGDGTGYTTHRDRVAEDAIDVT